MNIKELIEEADELIENIEKKRDEIKSYPGKYGYDRDEAVRKLSKALFKLDECADNLADTRYWDDFENEMWDDGGPKRPAGSGNLYDSAIKEAVNKATNPRGE